MNLAELIAFGECLASDLDAAAARYHVKSDQRDILGYESATVRAYLALLAHGAPVPSNLRQSMLLGAWGRDYPWDERELPQRASEFYRGLEALGVVLRQD
jgi:hypothetical protein